MFTTTPQLDQLPQRVALPQRAARTQHADRCPCEECLSKRIQLTAAMATPERPLVPLGVRQRRYRVRLATDGMQRRVS
jgi:hypothetical protein